jgi:hypothetical protein
LERQSCSSFSNPGKIEEEIESQDRRVESLRLKIERQKKSVERKVSRVVMRVEELERQFQSLSGEVEAVNDRVGGEIGKLKSETKTVAKSVSGLETLRPEMDSLALAMQSLTGSKSLGGESGRLRSKSARSKPSHSPKPEMSPVKIEIPMKNDRPLDGIISYLTKQHGGNVQENGIVAITSKSVCDDDPAYGVENVADLTSDTYFCSEAELGEWVCWDFRELRVRLTHYTIRADSLRSWVLEGSVDGRSWTAIDRQTKCRDFKGLGSTASFTVSKPAVWRFIRVTLIDQKRAGDDRLTLYALEFFGRLCD